MCWPCLLFGSVTTLYGGQIPPTCFSGPLPTTPRAPVYQAVMGDSDEQMLVELWRESCTDDSGRLVPLIRFTPQADPPFVCFSQFHVIQASIQYEVVLFTSSSGSTLCTTLFAPTTVILGQFSSQPPFDDLQSFTLILNDVMDDYLLEIEHAVDQVTIQWAIYFERVSWILLMANSSLAPQAQLAATVAGCFEKAPLQFNGSTYIAKGRTCPGINGVPVIVESSLGGIASATLQ
jgi:hypothetical protein